MLYSIFLVMRHITFWMLSEFPLEKVKSQGQIKWTYFSPKSNGRPVANATPWLFPFSS